MIGLSAEHVSRITNNKKPVGLGALRQAAELLGFDRAYFDRPGAHYKDFVRDAGAVRKGSHGRGSLGHALVLANRLLEHAQEADAVERYAEELAIEVTSLEAVHEAEQVIGEQDPVRRRALGPALAWRVKNALEGDPVLRRLLQDGPAKKMT